MLQQLALLKGFDLDALDMVGARFHPSRRSNAPSSPSPTARSSTAIPDVVDVPMATLLSDAYNDERRKLVTRDRLARTCGRARSADFGAVMKLRRAEGQRSAVGALGAGEPTVGRLGEVNGDTVHFDIVDQAGNMVSSTPSGGWLQSSPVIPELGFCLGTRAQQFWLEEDHPASLAPGKRPRTTLSPTMALRDGEPYLAWGSPGGDQQDQWTDAVLPAPRPRQDEPAGSDRRAGLALRAFPDLVLAAHRAPRRAGDRKPRAESRPSTN